MKDVIVTVVVAIVLAIAFMYILLSLAFSGWRDPAPTRFDDSAVPSGRVSTSDRSTVRPGYACHEQYDPCPARS